MVELSEEEFMRRREAIRNALTGAGLAVAAPVIDAAARLGERGYGDDDFERVIQMHALWFTHVPAKRHLPTLIRDFGQVNNFNKPLLAGMAGETLADLGEITTARQWFDWAAEHAHSRGQVEWLRGRESILYLDAGDMRRVPDNPVGLGSASYARAQAKLGNAEAARGALERAGRYTALERETYTAFTYPQFQWHADASKVHTRLGDTATAKDHQRTALDTERGFPVKDVTNRTLLNLDHADCLHRDGRREEARRHLNDTLALLPQDRRINVINARAAEIAEAIGGRI